MKSTSLDASFVPWDPHEVNGKIHEHIFVASDDRHEPTGAIVNPTDEALARFEQFNINVDRTWYWNGWDASDVSPADDSSNALEDLIEDTNVRDDANDIVIGWAHDMDHNGIAKIGGPYCVCSDSANLKVDWPHDSIVQHEVSHNFDAEDQGYWGYEHPECIMNYEWAYLGRNIWCSSCEDVVQYGIEH
ncbi:hypothetical protein Metev_1491 [Methanohalobium evestigatum Z-7303]|uniref:Uncharacterized protein n=1 Tax=Methanohalobium evestigatum (strain ATCC BAA-1072 / DSM 3721 / NBRC 107634 / OCM 161 / Z-7303) TaxID=644295 RepID=D7E9S1_METEZ|nr:hypothetical protein [Methanohalobium evestigatum]ADI74343.1 hypothetical protein Metev_1491 [Methanohalobium evestigatum Z-7303]